MKSLLAFQGSDWYRDRLKRQNGIIDIELEAHPLDVFGNKVVDLKGKININDRNRHKY